jgi:hypothetical protein
MKEALLFLKKKLPAWGSKKTFAPAGAGNTRAKARIKQ